MELSFVEPTLSGKIKRSRFWLGRASQAAGSERQRPHNRLVGGLRDGDADHGSAAANRTITSLKPTRGPHKAVSLSMV
jgi:hypothetical protein